MHILGILENGILENGTAKWTRLAITDNYPQSLAILTT